MAMNLGNDSGEDNELHDINVTPFIDVMLVLLIIFMVAAIPAVIIYNIFARMISGYRGEIGDIATGVVTLVSRDLDIEN
ncbi:biopolymer transporter ExbD, partial [Proteus mirabilis]|uniref:biopolymer transporter ExbD n=1 Tax=Proteus mirabilis TaxID=584 RepID=UPI003D9C9607